MTIPAGIISGNKPVITAGIYLYPYHQIALFKAASETFDLILGIVVGLDDLF